MPLEPGESTLGLFQYDTEGEGQGADGRYVPKITQLGEASPLQAD
jgi:hypothetical protein